MSRACLVLADDAIRAKARHWVDIAPQYARVTFQDPKRTDAQNRKFWPMLTDLSEQVPYHGVKLTPDDFKLLFLDALKREVRLVPNLDGNGFVNLGKSSSDLSVREMSDCIEIMYRFGAERGVKWTEPEPDMPPAPPEQLAADHTKPAESIKALPAPPDSDALTWAAELNIALERMSAEEIEAALADPKNIALFTALSDESPGAARVLNGNIERRKAELSGGGNA